MDTDTRVVKTWRVIGDGRMGVMGEGKWEISITLSTIKKYF